MAVARLLVVVALPFEARGIERRVARDSAAPLWAAIRAVGPGARRLDRVAADRGVGEVDAVLVTGLCGGCAPELSTGDIVVGREVHAEGESRGWSSDPGLAARAMAVLERAGLAGRAGRLLTSVGVVTTPAAKARHWRDDGALAVDMESEPVMAWAARRGLPALVARAVADGPADAVPPALAGVLDAEGRIRPAGVVALLGAPAALGAAWRLRRQAAVALDALARFLVAWASMPERP